MANPPDDPPLPTANPAGDHPAAAFARANPGSEASVMRIGAHSAQLILVAASGSWSRFVVTSEMEGRELCERLGITCHDGWPEALRRRAATWRRTPQEWAAAPYPERGHAR